MFPNLVSRLLPLALAGGVVSSAPGQILTLRTVPVATGDQFLFQPSTYLGMGSPTIALDDPQADPFTNPAARPLESVVVSAPTFYTISDGAGSARTLPVGTLVAGNRWFGALHMALQDLRRGGDAPPCCVDFLARPFHDTGGLEREAATNRYLTVGVGRRLGARVTVGANLTLADLNAVDGVEHLYAGSTDLAQTGHAEGIRAGLRVALADAGQLDATLVHQRFTMRHDVLWVDWIVTDSTRWEFERRERLETNRDQTQIWGAQFTYRRPVGTTGWQLGVSGTANRKLHPKIPNYRLMDVPRDPGHSNAFALGLGAAKVTEQSVFGIDVGWEPAWSTTWAEAEAPTATARGATIPAGGRTIENAFTFSNGFVHVGVSHGREPWTAQFGLRVRSYSYALRQHDLVAETQRRQRERWTEWVPSWGLGVRLADFTLQYTGRVTTGTGRPGLRDTGGIQLALAEPASDVLLAPSGPLTLQDVVVLTNRIAVTIPIR